MKLYLTSAIVSVLLCISSIETSSLVDELRAARAAEKRNECYDYDIEYTGTTLNDGYQTFMSSALECQQLCQQTNGCIRFTWIRKPLPYGTIFSGREGECWLKDTSTYTIQPFDTTGLISGPAECGPCNGIDNGCCTKGKPCKEDDGDCDNNDQCEGDLLCGTDNCDWGDGDDCCFKKGGPCNGIEDGCCTAENPCKENDGDCDSDDQCAGDLLCGTKNCPWGRVEDGGDCCYKKIGTCNGKDDCCTTGKPCKEQDGPCKSDDQCAGDLRCGDENCMWGGADDKKDNCCYKKGGPCTGVDDGCCTAANPCKENDGDCDNDNECEGDLLCGTDNCPWGDNDDCCYSLGADYKEKISKAISSTITNPLSTISQKIGSPRSKLLKELPNIVIDLGAEIITKHTELYKDIFKDLFLKIVANPELDDHFPNFSSAFQYTILPTAIQKEDPNSPLLKSKLKTPFPKAVEDSVQLEDKEVTIDGTYVDKCRFDMCWGGKEISTDFYAKQGQLVTVTVPENVVGKFAIRVGSHTDRVLEKNKERWLKNKKINRPFAVVQYYGKELIKQKTRLLTPYGGLIYITIQAPSQLGNFKLKFENVITSPRFKYGKTTNEEWSKMLASSKSPMIEIDIPGVIVTIPRSYENKNIDSLNMERCANEYTKMMKAFFAMQGYEMPRPHRYVYDVDITVGLAHSGYPVTSNGVSSELFELANKTDGIWVIPHEIGHNIQQSKWTPAGLGQTTNNIFAQYINEKIYNANFPWHPIPSLKYATKFKEGGGKFSSLGPAETLNIFKMVQQECTWEVYFKFFKYYNEEIPKASIPKTKETKYSTIAKVLSEKCNKNLIPFFKWWKWPVTTETEEATKKLPEWDGIIDILNKADKEGALRRCGGIDGGCCTKENPCKENDGDCDSNDDCAGDLVCGKDNCGKEDFWDKDDDCCEAADSSSSSAGCKKESDVDYYGFDLGSKKTSGEKECAEFCSSIKHCKVWSLRKSDGWCRIIDGDIYKITRAGFVSGTKQCGGSD